MKLLVHAALAIVALLLAPAAGWAQSAPARTAWGAPDLQGVWNHGTATPLERPERHAGRARLTADEPSRSLRRGTARTPGGLVSGGKRRP